MGCSTQLVIGGPAAEDAGVSPDAGPPLAPTEDLDLLFVIDRSGSMKWARETLLETIPLVVGALAEGVLRAPDGRELARFTPPRSLHAGVIDTDMGTGGFPVATCSDSMLGSDGVLREDGDPERERVCDATYPPVHTLEPAEATPEALRAFLTDVSCVAAVGGESCGFEQPLDALLKAITPASSSLRFQGDTRGNREANAGFLREGATLAVVLLTNEDDCSARDPELFNAWSVTYTGDLNLRCSDFPEALHRIERYALGLLEGRDPRRFVMLSLAGLPEALVPRAGERPRYGDILADPAMQQVADPERDTRLTRSCRGRVFAYPPRRLVGLAAQLEQRRAYVSLGSICAESYDEPLRGFVLDIAASMAGR